MDNVYNVDAHEICTIFNLREFIEISKVQSLSPSIALLLGALELQIV